MHLPQATPLLKTPRYHWLSIQRQTDICYAWDCGDVIDCQNPEVVVERPGSTVQGLANEQSGTVPGSD